jgi:hypothetical protein
VPRFISGGGIARRGVLPPASGKEEERCMARALTSVLRYGGGPPDGSDRHYLGKLDRNGWSKMVDLMAEVHRPCSDIRRFASGVKKIEVYQDANEQLVHWRDGATGDRYPDFPYEGDGWEAVREPPFTAFEGCSAAAIPPVASDQVPPWREHGDQVEPVRASVFDVAQDEVEAREGGTASALPPACAGEPPPHGTVESRSSPGGHTAAGAAPSVEDQGRCDFENEEQQRALYLLQVEKATTLFDKKSLEDAFFGGATFLPPADEGRSSQPVGPELPLAPEGAAVAGEEAASDGGGRATKQHNKQPRAAAKKSKKKKRRHPSSATSRGQVESASSHGRRGRRDRSGGRRRRQRSASRSRSGYLRRKGHY